MVKKAIYEIIFSPAVFRFLVRVLKIVATTGKGSSFCLKSGFLPVPVNFYSPIPDIADLEERDVWNKRSGLRGVDFREDRQIELLKELGAAYSDECWWSVEPTSDPFEFYVENPSFSYGCAALTHSLIRHFKPNRVIEIGSGMSSLVISKAIELNRAKDARPGRHIIVDPYPGEITKLNEHTRRDLIQDRVERLSAQWFDQLESNDILFIDSGHCVRIGGDVNFLFLDVLPRLRPGVIVHVHDIGLPYEYPKAYATNEHFRQFWTEQYLLQAFLCFNFEYEVLLAMNYLMTDHHEIFRQSFPLYDPDSHRFSSGSLWMRRKQI
jgi:hypothetical protein